MMVAPLVMVAVFGPVSWVATKSITAKVPLLAGLMVAVPSAAPGADSVIVTVAMPTVIVGHMASAMFWSGTMAVWGLGLLLLSTELSVMEIMV